MGRGSTDTRTIYKVDAKSKLIVTYDVTAASVHDSQRSYRLITEKDKGQKVWMDSGYVGTKDGFEEKGTTPIICEKGDRNHPLEIES